MLNLGALCRSVIGKRGNTVLKLKSYNFASRLLSFSKKMEEISYINQEQAIKIDEELFDTCAFSLDQLMELAGLSVAVAIAKTYPKEHIGEKPTILVCCGPGNNGGDGLVAARHFKHFGYEPSVFYPKKSNKPFLQALVKQCEQLDIPFIAPLPDANELTDQYKLIVDAIFGFSFKPPVRPEFATVIDTLTKVKSPICSVDIPSAWDVTEGGKDGDLQPELLISLTAPKLCAKHFKGKYHWLGGRFVPPQIAEKYKLVLPPYPGTEPCVLLNP